MCQGEKDGGLREAPPSQERKEAGRGEELCEMRTGRRRGSGQDVKGI